MISTIETSGKRCLLLAVAIVLFTAACGDQSALEQESAKQTVNLGSSTEAKSAAGNRENNDDQNGDLSVFSAKSSASENNSAQASSDELSSQDESQNGNTVESDDYSENQEEQDYYEPSTTVTFNAEESAGVIRWDAPEGVNYTDAQVTISAQGGDMATRNFNAGEPIELHGELPDGVYDWETVITPEINEYVRQEMREVRQSGDFQAERELIARLRAEGSIPTEEQARKNRQSGSFVVENGVVRPSLVDAPNSDRDNGG